MSTMPRLHWLKPRLSCWHCVGRVSRRGGERHSRGVWRETRMHSEFCRHSASAAPMRWVVLSVEEVEGWGGRKGGGLEGWRWLSDLRSSLHDDGIVDDSCHLSNGSAGR